MKNLLTLIALLLCTAAYAQTPITVSNQPGFDATYSDLQTAIDIVPAGSILYVHGSGVSYGDITIDKQLTLYGPGYLLAANEPSNTFENLQSAQLGYVTIPDGADGVIIIGFDIIRLTINSDNNIVTKNILDGCRLDGANSNTILNNFFVGASSGVGGITFFINTECSDVQIFGNIFRSVSNFSIQSNQASSNGIITNNTICNNLDVTNFNVKNNILEYIDYSVSDNTSFHHNIILANSATFDINNNQINIDITTMFEGESLNSGIDNEYQLKPNTAATGAADDGGDCGAFGGSSPYILSGLPNLPTVYQIISPVTTPSSGNMNITVKAISSQ